MDGSATNHWEKVIDLYKTFAMSHSGRWVNPMIPIVIKYSENELAKQMHPSTSHFALCLSPVKTFNIGILNRPMVCLEPFQNDKWICSLYKAPGSVELEKKCNKETALNELIELSHLLLEKC